MALECCFLLFGIASIHLLQMFKTKTTQKRGRNKRGDPGDQTVDL